MIRGHNTGPGKATRKSEITGPRKAIILSLKARPEKATIRGQMKSNNTRPQKQQYKARRASIWGRRALNYLKICGLILDNSATQSLRTISSRFFCSLFSLAFSFEAVFVLFAFVLSPFLLHSKCTG